VFFEMHYVMARVPCSAFTTTASTLLIRSPWWGPFAAGFAKIPFSLGWPILAVAGLNVVLLIASRRAWSRGQRTLAIFALVTFAVYAFMMTRYSQLAWEHLPLLARMQFPWRILSAASVLIALLPVRPIVYHSAQPCLVASLAVFAMCVDAVKSTSYRTESETMPRTPRH